MISKAIISVAGFCLFAGCSVSWREPKSNTCTGKASNPSPANGAKGVSPDTKLSWKGIQGASYDVYFGTESPPPFVGNQTGTTFDLGPLDWDRTYYWKVDSIGGAKGDIWKFTTFWYGDPNAEEMDVRLNDKDADTRHARLAR
ncbi:MAG: hypothetical protein ACYSW4_02050 [Planctomycetota bacterium]